VAEHRKIIDLMTPLRQLAEEHRKNTPLKETEPERLWGMKFRPGQKVRDKVTGEEVEILAGERATVTVSPAEAEGA